jgi:hypothetical protein
MQDFEKLGVFYLGKEFDLKAAKAKEDLILYDSKDLVTHGVCVGMTGSGKTGLCLSIIEEAAIDGIPAIVIDPKGDLANLLLTFPELRAEDFAPWINEDDARRKNLSPADFAAQQAKLWKDGLAAWGEDGGRIQRLRDSAEFAIYTPGSNAGLPISILKSFAAPTPEILGETDLLQERINVTATSLLGLLEIDADPLQSREHILISNIFATAWRAGHDLDLASLIQQIQQPPISKIGVMDLESFYPSKDRFALAMRLNNLLAAPGFENWMHGEALDVGALLHSKNGKPRVAIFSIAHLSDAERMFFVSLLLNQTLGWMRSQSGTTSLRALLYMDEIFGYFPPTANPPSKGPLLTLLKQARAFGLGIVLATQNPVDLDYKGLSNAGTWWIGRLQTDRDKQRVLDGLEGAAATGSAKFNRPAMEQLLAGLGSRVFLMNNVHEDAPVVFQTRWTLSYLRGPLTRDQIRMLMDKQRGSAASDSAQPTSAAGSAAPMAAMPSSGASVVPAASVRPVLPPDVPQVFIPLRSTQPAGAAMVYRPMLIGTAEVYYRDPKSNIDQKNPACLAVELNDDWTIDWSGAEELDFADGDFVKSPEQDAPFAPVPSAATQPKNYDVWKRSLADALYRTAKLNLWRSPSLGQVSNPNEPERDFRVRLAQAAREKRDQMTEQLKAKYAPKLASLQDRKRRAEMAEDVQAKQATASKLQTAISFGATVLSAFMGRKTISAGSIGRATTAARGVGRSMKESQDVNRAEENVEAIQQQYDDLSAQFKAETDALEAKIDPQTETLESISLRPKKTDIAVRLVALAWAPCWQSGSNVTPAWK